MEESPQSYLISSYGSSTGASVRSAVNAAQMASAVGLDAILASQTGLANDMDIVSAAAYAAAAD